MSREWHLQQYGVQSMETKKESKKSVFLKRVKTIFKNEKVKKFNGEPSGTKFLAGGKNDVIGVKFLAGRKFFAYFFLTLEHATRLCQDGYKYHVNASIYSVL